MESEVPQPEAQEGDLVPVSGQAGERGIVIPSQGQLTLLREQARTEGDQPKLRHLEDELKGLEEYKAHHPEDSHDPTPLEVYCDLNPDAPECRVYDD